MLQGDGDDAGQAEHERGDFEAAEALAGDQPGDEGSGEGDEADDEDGGDGGVGLLDAGVLEPEIDGVGDLAEEGHAQEVGEGDLAPADGAGEGHEESEGGEGEAGGG